jgi:hypothetical protein
VAGSRLLVGLPRLAAGTRQYSCFCRRDKTAVNGLLLDCHLGGLDALGSLSLLGGLGGLRCRYCRSPGVGAGVRLLEALRPCLSITAGRPLGPVTPPFPCGRRKRDPL